MTRGGVIRNVAVSDSAKGYGVGKMMIREIINYANEKKYSYLYSDTAIKAKSSVNMFLKSGFKVYGIVHHGNTNYWSYEFVYVLKGNYIVKSFIYRVLRMVYTCLKSFIRQSYTHIIKIKN